MPYFSPEEILTIFEDLPSHQGWDPATLDAVEKQIGGRFPPIYRKLMTLDAHRILGFFNRHDVRFVPPQEIVAATHSGQQIIEEEGFEFKLSPRQIVFAWSGHLPCFFEAIGADSVPIYIPDYRNKTSPEVCNKSVTDFFVESIKGYLKL